MRKRYFLLLLIFAGCGQLDDAPLTKRETFIYFYEGANAYTAATAEITPDGYIIAGTIDIPGDNHTSRMIVIKTNHLGQKQWEKIVDGGVTKSIKVVSDGYILVGDSIEFNPSSQETPIAELENSWSRLIYLDMNGNITLDRSFSEINRNNPGVHIDFTGEAVTLDEQGNLITLSTKKIPASNASSYVSALRSGTFDTLWSKEYNYINRDYRNTPSVFCGSGHILWAASVSETVGNFNRSYLTVPVVASNSIFVNSDYYGETIQQSLVINDFRSTPIGYVAAGTYAQTDAKKANAFFIRIDKNGNFIKTSARAFDGILSADNAALTDETFSESEDTGESITATSDGGFILAGSIETTPQRGNGGKDIWLIKIDLNGNALWNRIIGGPTNEAVASVRETTNGGLLICGTLSDADQQTGGLSSIFLMKTDKNGNITN